LLCLLLLSPQHARRMLLLLLQPKMMGVSASALH
jgi:hypothetical protein